MFPAYSHSSSTFALRALLDALAPLIGAEEATGKVVPAGWATDASPETLKSWREAGIAHQNDLDLLIQDVFIPEYKRLMRARLGLATARNDDLSKIIEPLLNVMFRHDLDFHATFRALAVHCGDILSWKPEDVDVDKLLISPLRTTALDTARSDLRDWLKIYHARRADDATSASSMLNANPRFILRQWVLEEVIKRIGEDVPSGRRVLAKLLQMCEKPFEKWGGEGKEEVDLSAEEIEERRMCGVGDTGMLGFQCSCSS